MTVKIRPKTAEEFSKYLQDVVGLDFLTGALKQNMDYWIKLGAAYHTIDGAVAGVKPVEPHERGAVAVLAALQSALKECPTVDPYAKLLLMSGVVLTTAIKDGMAKGIPSDHTVASWMGMMLRLHEGREYLVEGSVSKK